MDIKIAKDILAYLGYHGYINATIEEDGKDFVIELSINGVRKYWIEKVQKKFNLGNYDKIFRNGIIDYKFSDVLFTNVEYCKAQKYKDQETYVLPKE